METTTLSGLGGSRKPSTTLFGCFKNLKQFVINARGKIAERMDGVLKEQRHDEAKHSQPEL
ncbi:MAG: hypothetical protein HYW01_06445 [Deltaproteobacteria bacterium]|nr:hypothetical protein [Deltaproteobacteria bacterium]